MNYQRISLGLGAILVTSNFYTITLLGNSSKLPIFDLPVSNYSSYKVEATKQGYSIKHFMHDPKIVTKTESSQTPLRFSNKETVIRIKKEEVAGAETEELLDPEKIACLKRQGKNEGTGELLGTSIVNGSGATTFLANIPIVGWFVSGYATNKAQEIGRDIAATNC